MMRFCTTIVCSLLVASYCVAAPSSQPAGSTLALLPAETTLTGSGSRQSLVVEWTGNGQFLGEAGDVTFTSSDTGIVRIANRTLIPVADGAAVVTAKAGDLTAAAKVTVRDTGHPSTPTFRNDVQPILAAANCSSGGCHGAAAGKNGFKLSLRGYDNDGDWRAITRSALGRRLDLADPVQSLLLLKPTAAVAHKGGERIKVGSPEYQMLADWIAAGAPGPKMDDPRIERLEFLPAHVIVKPNTVQRLIVLAHFSDGTVKDVTRLAKYTASDTSVAINDEKEAGRVKVLGRGEGAITAWYLSRIAVATVTAPYEGTPPEVFAKEKKANFIDEQVLRKLQDLNLPPSPAATDEEFLRRTFLDTVGTLPSADEARAYLADTSEGKRARLIESLLKRPEFIDYWSYKWSDLLLVSSKRLTPTAMRSYYGWVREQVAANTPWDQLARKVVTATGSTLENGAANFYRLHDDPMLMSETVSVVFLGMSINCAKCHNHPMEKWTNDQYYGMANLFARVRTKNASGDGNFVVFTAAEGDIAQPLTGRPQPPRPLDGQAIPADSTADRRLAAADWLVSKDNPYFARAIANRVWANFMGVGLVEAVDDMRVTNPASNEQLLSALAAYLVDHHYDVQALMRVILESQTYQRSSQVTGPNGADRRFYSRYYPRRLRAEVALDALSQVTGAPTQFKDYPLGTRAMQLPDSNVDSYFLKTFGRPERILTCECERTSQPSMAQVLHLTNGDTINMKLQAKGNRLEQLLAANTPTEKIVEEAYLSALSRFPTASEKSELMATLPQTLDAGRREAIEDFYWSLLSSKGFLFNH